MSSPKHESADLSELISSANDQIAVGEARRKTRIYRSGGVQRLLSLVVVAGLLGAFAWALESMWHHFAPKSEARVVRDLDTVIEQARHAIESAKGDLGRLPERIPNAALASVVFYDYSGDAYRLFVTSGNVSVMLDTDGSKKVDKRGSK